MKKRRPRSTSAYSSTNTSLPEDIRLADKQRMARKVLGAALAVLDPTHECHGKPTLAATRYGCTSKQVVSKKVQSLREVGLEEALAYLRMVQGDRDTADTSELATAKEAVTTLLQEINPQAALDVDPSTDPQDFAPTQHQEAGAVGAPVPAAGPPQHQESSADRALAAAAAQDAFHDRADADDHKNCSENGMYLQAYLEGGQMVREKRASCRAVANLMSSKYNVGISYKTIHRASLRSELSPPKVGSPTRLTTEEEKSLVKWITLMRAHKLPVFRSQIMEVAMGLYKQRVPGDSRPLSNHWYQGFLERHNMKGKDIRPLEADRDEWFTPENIEKQTKVMQRLFVELGLAVENPQYDSTANPLELGEKNIKCMPIIDTEGRAQHSII
jgi:hypothetical protein